MFDMRPLADIAACVDNARLAAHCHELVLQQVAAQRHMMMQNSNPEYGLGLMNFFAPRVPAGWRDWYEIGDEAI